MKVDDIQNVTFQLQGIYNSVQGLKFNIANKNYSDAIFQGGELLASIFTVKDVLSTVGGDNEQSSRNLKGKSKKTKSRRTKKS